MKDKDFKDKTNEYFHEFGGGFTDYCPFYDNKNYSECKYNKKD
jgi:hypothetical protein